MGRREGGEGGEEGEEVDLEDDHLVVCYLISSPLLTSQWTCLLQEMMEMKTEGATGSHLGGAGRSLARKKVGTAVWILQITRGHNIV